MPAAKGSARTPLGPIFQDTSALLDYNNLVVCNYAKAGNFLNSVMYQTGAACSACPAGYTCDDGLCAK